MFYAAKICIWILATLGWTVAGGASLCMVAKGYNDEDPVIFFGMAVIGACCCLCIHYSFKTLEDVIHGET